MVQTPKDSDWNRFWQASQKSHSAKVSWSKRRVIKVVDPFLRAPLRVLDAGCGSGFFSKYFCERGAQVVALDYSDQALDVTRQLTRGKVKVVKCDLLCENLTNVFSDKFDLIFTDGLFEHFDLPVQDRMMQNFISVLSTDGKIATFAPNRWSPWELIRPFFMPGIDETPFVLSELVSLNKRNGLCVVAQGGVNVLPFPLSPEKIFGRFFGMLLYTVAKK